MRIKFNSNIDYQINAINSIVDIFDGIETNASIFTLSNYQQSIYENDNIFWSNKITTNEWKFIIKDNIKKIQKRNNIISDKNHFFSQKENIPIFDVEMETGTGKTYVFLRTILELNNKYGFKKFVIIVPSVAIKEGIKKTLDITKEHFNDIYGKINYEYNEYQGEKSLEDIINFGKDNNIKILIINIQSFNKIDNILNKVSDFFQGSSPIDFIQKTNPIVIIDEPQSTSNTKKSFESIKKLNPLFILRYSATFRKRENNEILLYRLSPIDAYNKGLVKKIIVHGYESKNLTSNIHAKLLSVKNDNNELRALLKLKIFKNNKENDKELTLKKGDDLLLKTGNDIFKNKYKIDEIIKDHNNYLDSKIIFLNGEEWKINYEIHSENHINEIYLKKNQIEKTIQLHLEKQLELYDKKIKVLSLFFIDDVKKYRHKYKNNFGLFNIDLGQYGKIFEESFIKIASNKKYEKLFKNKNIDEYVKKVHDGYFSIDGKNVEINSFKKGNNQTLDTPTYIKIMREKEKLLSFDEDLCFIFSHSALKEGWDNPNVFQICTLNKTESDIKKRQEIGRGLRLCLDQEGNRIYDVDVNKLSIITNESYEEFANSLQKELEEDGVFSKDIITFVANNFDSISFETKKATINFLQNEKFLTKNNLLRDEFSNSDKWKETILNLSKNYKDLDPKIVITIIEKYWDEIDSIKKYTKNGNNKINSKPNYEIINSNEFKNFINTIKYKSIYKTKINTNELIINSVKKIKKMLEFEIDSIKIISQEVSIQKIDNNKIYEGNSKKNIDEVKNENFKISLNEWINTIEKETKITKRTIGSIILELINHNNLKIYLEKNPFSVKKIIIDGINKSKNEMIIDNIQYKKINDWFDLRQIIIDHYSKLCSYDDENSNFCDPPKVRIIDDKINKTPYNMVNIQSKNEEIYLDDILIPTKNYIIFFKIPEKKFYINTPIGEYTPDWGIYDLMSTKKYFICETKGSIDDLQLRLKEKQKIDCAKKHFESLDDNICFDVESSNKY